MICEKDFIEMYCNAEPEVQKAVEQMVTKAITEDLTHESVRKILVDSKVSPDIIETFDKAYDIKTA